MTRILTEKWIKYRTEKWKVRWFDVLDFLGGACLYMGTEMSTQCMFCIMSLVHFSHYQQVCVHINIYWMMWWKVFIKSLLSVRLYVVIIRLAKQAKSISTWNLEYREFYASIKSHFHTWIFGSYLEVLSL